jgi:O-antigen/teichoic acid export membrane protein
MGDRGPSREKRGAREPGPEAAVADDASLAFEAASPGRNTAIAILAQVTTGAFTAALTLYLVRALGPDAYGVFVLALSIGVIAALLSDFGIPHSAARFLAESGGDRRVITPILRDALRLKLVSGALITGGLFAAAGPIAAAYDEPGLTWPLRAMALSLFAQTVLTLYLTAFMALGRIAVNLRLIFFESLTETAASIALVALGAGATGAAFGRAIGYSVGAALALIVVVRLFNRSVISPRPGRDGRTSDIARYAAPLFVITSAYILYSEIDVLLIGALLGTTAVGVFAAPIRLTVPLRYVGQAVANSIAPRQAEGVRDARSVELFEKSLRWLIIYQAFLVAPLVVWADPIVQLLLGPEFSESADVLRILAFYLFLDGPSPLISTTVNYLGHAARRIPIVLASLAVNIAVDLALLPLIGVIGAAIGTCIAYSLYVPAHFRICRRELGLNMRPLAVTLSRALSASVVMGLVLLPFESASLSPAAWVLGGGGAVLAFCSVLVLSGEVTRGEFRHGLRTLRTLSSQLGRSGPR